MCMIADNCAHKVSHGLLQVSYTFTYHRLTVDASNDWLITGIHTHIWLQVNCILATNCMLILQLLTACIRCIRTHLAKKKYTFAGSPVRDTYRRTQVKFVHTNWKVLAYLPHTYRPRVSKTYLLLTTGTFYMYCTLYLIIIMIILLQYLFLKLTISLMLQYILQL